MTRILTLALIALSTISLAQVNQTVIVEHFTNTRCSICASRNPGFFNNLNNNQDVLHIAFHPSAPYSNCVLNQHNVSGNDDRTNFYSVYGSTPRIVIQGDVISAGTNYGGMNLFTPYQGQTSAFSITFDQVNLLPDSIEVELTVTVEDTHSVSNLNIYVALTEDTIFYNAPNGENEHFNVFRVALTPFDGTMLSIPGQVGQTVSYKGSAAISQDWMLDRIFPIAILQDVSSKEIMQSAKGPAPEAPTSINNPIEASEIVFPNVVKDELIIKDTRVLQVSLFDLNGKEVLSQDNWSGRTSTHGLASGLYVARMMTEIGVVSRKVVKY